MMHFGMILDNASELREVVTWRLMPVAVIAWTVWYCRKKGVGLKIKTFLITKFMGRLHKREEILMHKKELFSRLEDKLSREKKLVILEIGVGGGSNFEFYPPGSQIICLDPNPIYEAYVRDKSREAGVDVQRFIKGPAEDLSRVEDSSVDAVVSTFVFCCIQDTNKVLEEIIRVLKPEGVFYFMEHVLDKKGTFLNKAQKALHSITGTGVQKETGRDIEIAGFSNTEINNFYCNTFLFMIKPMVWGRATK